MTAGTEALIATVAAAVAAVAGLAAVVVSAVSLLYSRRMLRESKATIIELEKIRDESQGTIAELQKLGEAAQAETLAERATTVAQHMILGETRASRDLELLRDIAGQVVRVCSEMRKVRAGVVGLDGWHPLQDAQNLLTTQLAGLPDERLPECRVLIQADPRFVDHPGDKAIPEIRKAIEEARDRLAAVTAAANGQLRQLARVDLFIPGDPRAAPPC